ncbi:MAG: glycine dehydrogenase (aminomethyl-transferring), partial [Verrucomicrobia bacterium]
AERIHRLARILAAGIEALGGCYRVSCSIYFDTLSVCTYAGTSADIAKIAEARRINIRILDSSTVCVSLDESTTENDLKELLEIFKENRDKVYDLKKQQSDVDFTIQGVVEQISVGIPGPHARTSKFLTHPVFNRCHSETEMLRYLKRLESRDLSLTTSMIPLGSCTMKLNATCEMVPVSWPEFSKIHPFAPLRQTKGYQELFQQLEEWLGEITGFPGISLQPNAGSQGEYAGLLVIRAYQESRAEGHRHVCLIPTSAHGTNPASAMMAGLRVVAVACDNDGNIDVADLRAKADAHQADLACLMVTYPSTHGVFEAGIKAICDIVHEHGGQVYMDGANLNAMVGLCRPAELGADVCHLNLHKTFCIPHGGGGPGMGPIGVAEHLVPFLPSHPVVNLGGEEPIGAVSAAPWGSASILTISWVY